MLSDDTSSAQPVRVEISPRVVFSRHKCSQELDSSGFLVRLGRFCTPTVTVELTVFQRTFSMDLLSPVSGSARVGYAMN